MRLWLFLGGLNGLLAVAAGAYGHHGFGGDEGAQALFATGAQYQMWHALALLAVAWLATVRRGRTVWLIHGAGVLFALGIVLFSGSLYHFALLATLPFEGAAPAGGMLMMGGWLAIVLSALWPSEGTR